VNFRESESYLYSLGNEVEAMKLGLENIRALLASLGNPHDEYIKVQVAGTNGKGSVCAFLDSICRKAGIKTGLFTSPHLVSITERIRIDGLDINETEFAGLATRVRETAERLLAEGTLGYTPTYFEQVTAIGLLAFAGAKVELAILETGLGGRLDATTAADAEIVAITQIALDHQEYLGDTIEEIAAEKAAIIREHTEVAVISRQTPAVMNVLHSVIGEADSRGLLVRETAVVFDESALGMPLRSLVVHRSLPGAHQVENAEVSILLADNLRKYFHITDENIRDGLRTAIHPGRLEYIGNFLLDGAHNVAGAKALLEFLTYVEKRPIVIIFGAMRGKDVTEIAKILFPRAERLILTRPSNSRAMAVEELLQFVPKRFQDRMLHTTESVAEAISTINEIDLRESILLVTGSLYLVGEMRNLLSDG
jgi:dihydrofolate synthase/folylpolyglutamate synthase